MIMKTIGYNGVHYFQTHPHGYMNDYEWFLRTDQCFIFVAFRGISWHFVLDTPDTPWLVVWNMFMAFHSVGNNKKGWFGTWFLWLSIFFHNIYGNNHPNWRTHLFQRGRSTTNQHRTLLFCRTCLTSTIRRTPPLRSVWSQRRERR